jgi:hypothetical protein
MEVASQGSLSRCTFVSSIGARMPGQLSPVVLNCLNCLKAFNDGGPLPVLNPDDVKICQEVGWCVGLLITLAGRQALLEHERATATGPSQPEPR